MQELSNGARVGVQRGSDYFLMLPCEAVAVIAKGNHVKTILTKDQAVANMQLSVVGRRGAFGPLSSVTDRRAASIGALAARHVMACMSKAKRNEELRGMCATGTREHACYLAAIKAASAVMDEIWEAAYRSMDRQLEELR
jgi:hypothetical protein